MRRFDDTREGIDTRRSNRIAELHPARTDGYPSAREVGRRSRRRCRVKRWICHQGWAKRLKRIIHGSRIAFVRTRSAQGCQRAHGERRIHRAVSVVVFGHLDVVEVNIPSIVDLSSVVNTDDDVAAHHRQSRHANLVNRKDGIDSAASGRDLATASSHSGYRVDRRPPGLSGLRGRSRLVRRGEYVIGEGAGRTGALRVRS